MRIADLEQFDGRYVEAVVAVPSRTGPNRSFEIERTSVSGTLTLYPKGGVGIGQKLTVAGYVEQVEALTTTGQAS